MHALFMIGTGMSRDRLGGFGMKNVSQKMFVNGCLLPRDSAGLCLFFLAYAEFLTASKVYRSACMLNGGYWNVFRDMLGVFGVEKCCERCS